MASKSKLKLINFEGIEGYTMSNIADVLGKEMFKEFEKWMNGQTVTVYQQAVSELRRSAYKNGDSLVYVVDLIRFLKKFPPLD